MKQLVFPILLLLTAAAFVGCATASPLAAATAIPTLPLPTEPQSTEEPTRTIPVPSPIRPSLPDLTPQIPPPVDNAPTRQPGGGPVITDPTLLKLVNDAKNDLTHRANVLPDEIKIVSAEPVEWQDASLGCPKRGVMYIQVITPGYLIVLQAANQQWEYHASHAAVNWCEK